MKKEYKEKIVKFYKNKKRLPSYSEMLQLFGLSSKNSVFKIVQSLVKENFLFKDQDGKLSPSKIFNELKFLGVVEAGFPSAAEEELVDTMSLDEYLIENKEASYILKVKGDSMIEAGICEGDMVVAERKGNPKIGDIVIAEIDGGWTMKYLDKEKGAFFLRPANKNYKPIYPKEDLKIAAVVKAVIRKY